MIKLDNEYYVTADTRNFALVRRYKGGAPQNKKLKQRDECESVVGYYGNMTHVIAAYRKEQMLTWAAHDNISIEQLCERVIQMDAELSKKLDRLMTLTAEPKPKRTKKTEQETQTT